MEVIGAACFVVTIDLDTGHCKVLKLKHYRPKTFLPNENKCWINITMVLIDLQVLFVAVITKIKLKWYALYDSIK